MTFYCGRCGSPLGPEARFCGSCGAPVASPGQPAAAVPPPPPFFATRLIRPRANRMVAGVCAGLAMHYGWDIALVRVLTVLITIFSSGAGLIAYIVFWIVMPEEPFLLPGVSYTPPQTPPSPPPAASTNEL